MFSIFPADMLFQRLVRETQTEVTSSSYGLQPVKNNGVAHRATSSDTTSPAPFTKSSELSKKAD